MGSLPLRVPNARTDPKYTPQPLNGSGRRPTAALASGERLATIVLPDYLPHPYPCGLLCPRTRAESLSPLHAHPPLASLITQEQPLLEQVFHAPISIKTEYGPLCEK